MSLRPRIHRRFLIAAAVVAVTAGAALALAASVWSAGNSAPPGTLTGVSPAALAVGGITVNAPETSPQANSATTSSISQAQAEQIASSAFGGSVLESTFGHCQAPTAPVTNQNCWAVSLDPNPSGQVPAPNGQPWSYLVVLVDAANGNVLVAQRFAPN
jgi:hypothetical protein